MTKYNGWSNYETWNFKLWLDNDQDVHNYIIGEIKKIKTELNKKDAEKNVNVAKYAYKKAYDAGDAQKVLDAQEKLTDAKIKLDKLGDIALQEEEVPVQRQEEAVQPDAKASDWAKENAWFGDDEEMTAYAMGVQNKIVREGVAPSSDE